MIFVQELLKVFGILLGLGILIVLLMFLFLVAIAMFDEFNGRK